MLASAAAAARVKDRSLVEQPAEGARRAAIAQTTECDDRGDAHLLIVCAQLIEKYVDHTTAVSHQRLDQVGTNVQPSKELCKRSLDVWLLDPAEEQHEAAQLLLRRPPERLNELLCSEGAERCLELGNNV